MGRAQPESVSQANPGDERTPPTTGLKLIIAYKVAKVPVMLALSLWLTLAPTKAYEVVAEIAYQLSSAGSIFAPLGDWLASHLSLRAVRGGALLAWIDTLFTAAEAVLLILRKPWSEWLVAIGLGALLPLEIVSLGRRFSIGKLVVLAINAVVVCYLVWRRSHQAKSAPRTPPGPSEATPTVH